MRHEQDQQQIRASRYRQWNDRGIDHRNRKKPQGAETHEPVQPVRAVGCRRRLTRLTGGRVLCGCLNHWLVGRKKGRSRRIPIKA
jgi:hypothetical protein